MGTTTLPEKEPERGDLRKRAKYLRRCKDAMWKRWTREYLRALRERHGLKHSGKEGVLGVGDVVIIHSEERNRGKWPLGVVKELYPGRDGVVRAVKLQVGRGYIERAINQLYPLELTRSQTTSAETADLNPEAPVFRPARDAAIAARLRIQELTRDEGSV